MVFSAICFAPNFAFDYVIFVIGVGGKESNFVMSWFCLDVLQCGLSIESNTQNLPPGLPTSCLHLFCTRYSDSASTSHIRLYLISFGYGREAG